MVPSLPAAVAVVLLVERGKAARGHAEWSGPPVLKLRQPVLTKGGLDAGRGGGLPERVTPAEGWSRQHTLERGGRELKAERRARRHVTPAGEPAISA
jgi:hypothetical protein